MPGFPWLKPVTIKNVANSRNSDGRNKQTIGGIDSWQRTEVFAEGTAEHQHAAPTLHGDLENDPALTANTTDVRAATSQFSSVRIYVSHRLLIKILTAALTHSSC